MKRFLHNLANFSLTFVLLFSVFLNILLTHSGAVLAESPPDIEWLHQIGSSAADDARSVAVDGEGNIYIAGYVAEALDGQSLLGKVDAFVQKYDSDGNELWTRQFGGSVDDRAYGIAIDSVNNIYVAGYTSGTLPGQKSSGSIAAFLRKYDSDGNELWTSQFGTEGDNYVYAVAVDKQDKVYVVGNTAGTLLEQSSSGFLDVFVRKYDGDGTELWTRQFGSKGHDYCQSIAIDRSNNVYLGGWTEGTLLGCTSVGGLDAFVRKYNSAGKELWTVQFGTGSGDYISGIAVDSLNNVCVAGYTFGTLPGQRSEGRCDAFVGKYDSSGKELWTHQFGTYENDMALGAAVDDNGNVYFSGNTYAKLPGQTGAGYLDAFIRKYDSGGSELWTYQFGTRLDDEVCALTIDSKGAVYGVGSSRVGLPALGQKLAGSECAFLRKFSAVNSQSNNTGTDNVSQPELPSISIEHLKLNPEQVLPGQQVTVSLDVVNNSKNYVDYMVRLEVNGQTENTTTINIAPGSLYPVVFTVSKSSPGTYHVVVENQEATYNVVSGKSNTAIWSLGTPVIVVLAIVGIAVLFALVFGIFRLVKRLSG